MQIIVEVGSREQKVLIENELTDFKSSLAEFESDVDVSKIIIAHNYEERINSLLKESVFKSVRGTKDNPIVGLGRIIQDNESYIIVFAPEIYCEAFDSQTRYYLFLHEVAHIINKTKLQFPKSTNKSKDIYLHDMYYFYDEYIADRIAYNWHDLIIKEKSNLWNSALNHFIEGFSDIINDNMYYLEIQNELYLFRMHGNADKFLASVKPYIYPIISSITHYFSFIHHGHMKTNTYNINNSHFINNSTIKLMDIYKRLYQNKSYNLNDFIPIMIEFMRCFGIIHEDIGEKLWFYAPII